VSTIGAFSISGIGPDTYELREPNFSENPLKLLIVSHACATPLNQGFFSDVEEVTGWKLSLILPETWKTEYIERQAEKWPALAGDFHPTPVWKSGNIPLHVYRNTFLGLLKKFEPNAIYVQHEPYGAATAQIYLANKLSKRVPIGFYAAQNIFKNYPFPFRFTEKMILRESSFCFPVTNEALQVLRAKGYSGDAEVLPLAVDSSLYRPMDDTASRLRKELGIGLEEPIIGYLGRFVPEKGLLTLVKALKLVESLPWRCVLVGSGPLEAEIRSAIVQAGLTDRVIFPGYIAHTDAPTWLSMFDLLTLPSETHGNWKEQFGRVIVEANACGTPVVGTMCGEIPTVINHTGGGLVVPECSPEDFASALEQLIRDPVKRAELGRRGRVVASREYDQHFLATRFAEVISRNVKAGATSAPEVL
jgi:glycosyltransferase involved in cell wall biosynthesis